MPSLRPFLLKEPQFIALKEGNQCLSSLPS